MEVMDADDDEDERRDVGESALSKDSGRGDGGRSSPILITKSKPIILKPSDSQIDIRISDSAGNKGEQSISKSPAKSSLSSTPEKGFAPFHENASGRNERIKRYYWKLWFGSIDIDENFVGPDTGYCYQFK